MAAGAKAQTARPESSPYTKALPYAPGLDGVRALAVAGVVLYHANLPWAPGGFLGVDVFFVLSGYLITSLLLAEHRRTGRIHLLKFWAGRIRRLLPAAVLVIAVCLVVEALFFPGNLAKLRVDALTALLYVNNWHQVFAAESYFNHFGRPSLVQHYWSLSVEEQFYFVWPIVLAGGLAISRRGLVVVVIVCAAIASALLMALLYHEGGDPSRVYFGTDTRATPLMVGAILAFVWPLGRMTAMPGRNARVMLDSVGIAGLVALLLMMHSWHDFDPFLYRGGFVLAAFAAAALIGAAGHPASLLGVALGKQPLRWIGQRSYGIYLWHWPIMALTRPGIDVMWSTWVLVPAQVALTLIFAELSFRYVEMPIRRRVAVRNVRAWLDRRRPRERLLSAVGAAAVVLGVLVAALAAPVSQSSAEHQLLASAAAKQKLKPVSSSVHFRVPGHLAAVPPYPVLAVGASVMLAAAPALEERFHAKVDAAVGRQPDAILDRLQEYRSVGGLPATVIVQIGDNGPIFSDDVARLRSLLTGVPHVILVNIREQVSWESEVNSALVATASSWPQAAVANWDAASANPDLTYDGAHPNPAGQVVYADVVARALQADAAKAARAP